jgi:hypothetical protein
METPKDDAEKPDPNLPPPPGNGYGDPPPDPLSLSQISPIAGALAGGFDVTLTGTGFQPGAEGTVS